jgi:hypothetical protein
LEQTVFDEIEQALAAEAKKPELIKALLREQEVIQEKLAVLSSQRKVCGESA